MSEKPSKFWTFIALPASLVVLLAAYYLRVPSVRQAIDSRTPIVRQVLGRFVPASEDSEVVVKTERPAAAGPRPDPAVPVVGGSPASPAANARPAVFDLQSLARDRSLWPKKVRLTKPANFPAVLNGKVVGSLVAPAGSEANLLAIKDGKVGLEFQGGGTWLAVEDTDLQSRVPLR
jgi:hypothetical protein